MSASQQVFAKILQILKPIESEGVRARHSFNFSGHGRDQNLRFVLYFNRAERGAIAYELLEKGEQSIARNMLLAGRDVILPQDVAAVAEQMDVLEVSPVIGGVVASIVAGLKAIEVSAPVFTLSKSEKRISNNEIVYVFGLAAYVLDDAWEPIGRIMFSMEVFKMSPLERTAMKLREAEDAKRNNGEPSLEVTEASGVVKVAPRHPELGRAARSYALSAMLQPDSIAMQANKTKQGTGLVREMATGGSYEGKTRANVPDEDGPREPNPVLDKLVRNEVPNDLKSGHSSLTADCRAATVGHKLTDMHGSRGICVDFQPD